MNLFALTLAIPLFLTVSSAPQHFEPTDEQVSVAFKLFWKYNRQVVQIYDGTNAVYLYANAELLGSPDVSPQEIKKAGGIYTVLEQWVRDQSYPGKYLVRRWVFSNIRTRLTEVVMNTDRAFEHTSSVAAILRFAEEISNIEDGVQLTENDKLADQMLELAWRIISVSGTVRPFTDEEFVQMFQH